MPDIKDKSQEIEKNELIFQEYLKIGSLFGNIAENKFFIIAPLLRDAAFQRVTLDELSDIINEYGAVEEYRNGENQYGQKQSAALQSYNNLMKIYTVTIKTLLTWLPREKSLSVQEEWERKRMEPEELEAVLLKEREENAKASALWLEKLKAAYEAERIGNSND